MVNRNSQLQESLLSDSRQSTPRGVHHVLRVDSDSDRAADNFESLLEHAYSQNERESAATAMEAKTRRSKMKRNLRNPINKKSLVRQAAHSATHEPAYFLKHLLWGLVLWPKWTWNAMRSQKNLSILSLKAGMTAGLASIVCVLSLPDPYSNLPSIGIWAVVTIDILSEANIGLSLSKGVNRVAGTFSAGALAVMLTQLGPDVPASIYPYYVVFWVALGGFVLRFLKGIPPLKEQWGYAFTVATLSFHILLLSSYQQPEYVTLPLLRFAVILIGFLFASIVNLAFKPLYAGDALHSLVAKNFDAAADILSRCVTDYLNTRMLDHVPDILSGQSEDDKVHQSYHEIVMSDSDVDKLLNAVTWEPCHGPFFRGYPWHLYDDITDYLRYTLYDVIALDSCLRASIQAPKHLRDLFSQEMHSIAVECSNVLHTLGNSMRGMHKISHADILRKAEEAALALQNKIFIHTNRLLGKSGTESPYPPASNVDAWSDLQSIGILQQSDVKQSPPTPFHFSHGKGNEKDNSSTSEKTGDGFFSVPKNSGAVNHISNSSTPGAVENVDGFPNTFRRYSAPVAIPHQQNIKNTGMGVVKGHASSYGTKEIGYSSPHGLVGTGLSAPEYRNHRSSAATNLPYEAENEALMKEGILHSLSDSLLEQAKPNIGNPSTKLKSEASLSWKKSFTQRRSSLGRDWEGTLERISALSLVKFASLLIEIVAKLQFVVNSVDDLSQAANFAELTVSEDLVYSE